MSMTEDVIFSDPVLRRIFFDGRRFAPQSESKTATVNLHLWAITEKKRFFLKTKNIETAERLQLGMRAHWLALREFCDGYFIDIPVGDGCEHVVEFAHDRLDQCFAIDFRARSACWHRYGRRTAPPWRTVAARLGRRSSRKI